MTDYKHVTYETLEDGAIARIMLNRPDSRNAQSRGLLVDLDRAMLAAEADDQVRVVILGGLTSVPGAIIGGLVIGAGEKISEVFLGPAMGGGIEIWFAYVVALLFLLFRPQGMFGERIIERV